MGTDSLLGGQFRFRVEMLDGALREEERHTGDVGRLKLAILISIYIRLFQCDPSGGADEFPELTAPVRVGSSPHAHETSDASAPTGAASFQVNFQRD